MSRMQSLAEVARQQRLRQAGAQKRVELPHIPEGFVLQGSQLYPISQAFSRTIGDGVKKSQPSKKVKHSKAERKWLKRLKRDMRSAPAQPDLGRQVVPHRSGGALSPLQFQSFSTVVGGVEIGPCTVTMSPFENDKGVV